MTQRAAWLAAITVLVFAACDLPTGGEATAVEVAELRYRFDPEGEGPFEVIAVDVVVNSLPARIYAPGWRGRILPGHVIGRRPLIVVSPGFDTNFSEYEHFSTHFASWGYVALGVNFPPPPGPLGVDHPILAAAVSSAATWAGAKDSPVGHLVDLDRLVFAGHSLGGKIAMQAAADDPRVAAVVAWDPVDLGGPPCFIDPVACRRWSVTPERMDDIDAELLIFGGLPGICSPAGENHVDYAAEATSPLVHVTLPGSDHLDWGIDAGIPFGECGPPGPTAGTDVHRIARRTQIAWLLGELDGFPFMDRFIDGSEAADDIAAGTIIVERNP